MILQRSLCQSGRVKKLMCGAAGCLLLCAASPSVSFAAEKLRCEYKFLDGSNKGGDGASKIEISGNTLNWFVQSPVPFLPKPKISYIESHFKILVQNKIGVVAVDASADAMPDIGPVIGAEVLTIRKSDGALRIGSVVSTGVYDRLAGHCK